MHISREIFIFFIWKHSVLILLLMQKKMIMKAWSCLYMLITAITLEQLRDMRNPLLLEGYAF